MADFYNRYVPDDGPENARILFVGEAPGETEHNEGKPFVGPSGEQLMLCLARHGLGREEVRLANLFHFRPFNNDFKKIVQHEIVKQHITELFKYIMVHRPYVVVPLGSWPLFFLTGKRGIKKWRGSILKYLGCDEEDGPNVIKVIPTFHPAAVLRDRGLYPTFNRDIKRIIEDSAFRERRLPVRQFVCDPRGLDLEEWVQTLCKAPDLACDIETVKKSTHIICVGFAPSPDVGVCLVPTHAEGRRAIERVLESKARKIFQFGTFDTTQLRVNGFQVCDPYAEALNRPFYWDTFLAQHVLAPELPRSLEYLTSVHTREPYYKQAGRGSIPDDAKGWSAKFDKQTLYEYNSRDCCCTFEVYLKQRATLLRRLGENWFDADSLRIFDFEMRQLFAAVEIALAGMYIDQERRALLERVLLGKWAKKQFILDRMTGYETNVRSPKLKAILYDKDKLGLPVRRNRKGGVTTDEDAIVSLISFCKDKLESVVRPQTITDWKIKLAVCQTVLEIRGIRQVLSNYILEEMRDGTHRSREDGRIHSIYKVGGTETGRWSASKFIDGTGFNAQTLPRDPVEVPDEALTKPPESVILVPQLAAEQADEEAQDEGAEEEDEVTV